MVKKYYDDHEGAYRTIKERGEFGWQSPTLEDFKHSMATELVTSVVKRHFTSTTGKTALDLGCGTGPTALTLHNLGFRTTGIDISPTAIELARKMHEGIHFAVADVLTYEGKFDFIYDSHCFHCIVLEEDRSTFLTTLKHNLLPEGAAFIDTMVWREGYKPGIETLRFDENFILWHPTKDHSRMGCENHEGRWWCPQRRIYPPEKVLAEISQAGLKVLWKNLVTENESEAHLLQVLVSV
jgi:2-polyprenyl-3-methyl-5-hydroxy-6-metoxy-1,4-benzoquinol methylase